MRYHESIPPPPLSGGGGRGIAGGGDGGFLLISFDPSRTVVDRVSANGFDAHQVDAPSNYFVVDKVAALKGERIELTAEYSGLRPVLLRSVSVLEGAESVEQAKDVARTVRPAQIREELRKRRREAAGPTEEHRFKRFFLAFDALTLVELLEHVSEGRLGREEELRDVFRTDRIDLTPERAKRLRERILRLLGQLPGQFLEAAFHLGLRLHAPLARLEGRPDPRLGRGAAFDPEAVSAVAAYLLEIFATEFHPPRDGRLDEDVVAAFLAFANGRLRFECARERNIANGEPDGAMFLAFAEFAYAAGKNDLLSADEREHWRLLFRMFVALQEVFLARYGPRTAPHTFDRYNVLLNDRGRMPMILEASAQELFDCYAGRSLEELLCKHLEHVYLVHRDDPAVVCGWRAEI